MASKTFCGAFGYSTAAKQILAWYGPYCRSSTTASGEPLSVFGVFTMGAHILSAMPAYAEAVPAHGCSVHNADQYRPLPGQHRDPAKNTGYETEPCYHG